MTTPAPELTRRERAAIARLLRAADALGELAQRVLEGQMAVRERELVRWTADAVRAGLARPLFAPEVYLRAGIPGGDHRSYTLGVGLAAAPPRTSRGLVAQDRLASRRTRVWLNDELSSLDAQKRLRPRDRRAVARILREADELSLTAQRELWRAIAARERARLRGGGSRSDAR